MRQPGKRGQPGDTCHPRDFIRRAIARHHDGFTFQKASMMGVG
jgi:hypothetical protein